MTASASEAETLFQRANSLLGAAKVVEALGCYLEANRLRPNHPETLANIGVCHAEQGKLAEAIAWYDAAIQLKPGFAQAHYNRGNALHAAKQFVEALAAYDRALGIDNRFARAWNNRGLALMRLGRARTAADSYAEAIKLTPAFPEARNNLGLALQSLGALDQALDQYNEALRLDPSFVPAHSNRAQAWLLGGDFGRGWFEYEWRTHLPGFNRFPRELPRWDGSPLQGRSILVRHEQGLGDTLQFVRYLPLLKELGAATVFECPTALRPTLESFPAIDRLIDRSDSAAGCDCQVNLLSLPAVFRTRLATIPPKIPYLAASPARIEHWRSRLPRNQLLIGICWRGSPDYPEDVFRSIPLSAFAPLAAIPGVRLVSLQKGPGVEEIASFRDKHALVEMGDELDQDKPFLDTAAVMSLLDLIVTADTSIGHLAGALGRPVWIALTLSPDWRWLLNRNDSPWYPSVRLFRQHVLGDWASVFQEMAATLSTIAHSRNSTS